jgi:hypothetical protein
MRELSIEEVALVAGGEMTCSVGFPSGVSCEGTLSEWRSAASSVWKFVSYTMPLSGPAYLRYMMN